MIERERKRDIGKEIEGERERERDFKEFDQIN